MRKMSFLAVACAAAACISCTKEESNEVNLNDGCTTIIKANLVTVKTSVGEQTSTGTYPVLWSDSDVICINGIQSGSIEVLSPASSANFTMDGTVTAPLCGLYPASAYVADSFDAAKSTMTIVVPAVQKYVEGSFDPEAAVMLAYNDVEGSIAFQNAMAYLKITIAGGVTDEKIRSITVKSRSKKQVSGEFQASFSNSGCALVVPDGESSSTITLECGNSGIEQGVPMIIALPGQNYTGGLDITVTDIRGRKMEIKSAKDLDLSAGTVYPTTIAYSAEPVSFPVFFPIGYAADQISENKSTSNSKYCHASSQTLWRPSSNSTADGIYITNLQPQKAVFVSKSQPQATFKWHWVNKPEAYRAPGKTYNAYVEFSGGTSGSSTLLAGPGIKGIWTGDYFEFDLPVRDFKANTTIEFTFAVCNKNAPTFWEVRYLDGSVWKTTATDDCPAPDGVTTATATWAIPYNYSPKLSTRMTFVNGIAAGHIKVRLACVDGSVITTGLTTVETGRAYPYGSTGCAGNFYLCEKSAERNDGKTRDAWGNAIIDQTQSISFTIVE